MALCRVSAKPDDALKEVLPKGVAYHHSGLSSDERVVVERAFCSGAVAHLDSRQRFCCIFDRAKTADNDPAVSVLVRAMGVVEGASPWC
jgi:hypothetical protein